MGNRVSQSTTSDKNNNVAITLLLEQDESQLKPGDIVRGRVQWTDTTSAINHVDDESFRRLYKGVTITVTGVEYAISNYGQGRLIVTDTFKLGRTIDFDDHHTENDQQRYIEYPFELELPAAGPQVEIDMGDYPFEVEGQQAIAATEGEAAPDAKSLGSCSISEANEDDDHLLFVRHDDDDRDDDDDWEMLSSKRHSFMRPTMVRKQYAYKVRSQLLERRQPQEEQVA